jgi:hypothetical protein
MFAQHFAEGAQSILERDTERFKDAQVSYTAQVVGFHDVRHDLSHVWVNVHVGVNDRAMM